jgi:hypothetical protein
MYASNSRKRETAGTTTTARDANSSSNAGNSRDKKGWKYGRQNHEPTWTSRDVDNSKNIGNSRIDNSKIKNLNIRDGRTDGKPTSRKDINNSMEAVKKASNCKQHSNV